MVRWNGKWDGISQVLLLGLGIPVIGMTLAIVMTMNIKVLFATLIGIICIWWIYKRSRPKK